MSAQNVYKPSIYTIKVIATSDLNPFTLHIRSPDQPTRLMGSPAPNFTKVNLGNELDSLRKKLSEWANDYNYFLEDPSKDQLMCNPDKVKKVWIELAKWGRGIYRMLFNLRGQTARDAKLSEWSHRIEKRKGSRITIDSPIGHIPWGLLYDAEVLENLGDDYLASLLLHFWATSYELDILPDYPESSTDWDTSLDNNKATRLTVGVNQDISGGYGLKQIEFFDAIPKNLISLKLSRGKRDLIDSITEREEPQHLLYFFCHHQKGKTWSEYDFRDLNDSKILIRGNSEKDGTDGTIYLKELESNELINEFAPPCPPVTFLNGCMSSQVEIGDPTSFMYYFIYWLGSQAFIGTESKIPAAFADAFGRRFVKEFIEGRRIGDILYDARLDYARKYHNPFGLYYTLYGNGNIRLRQPAGEEAI
jgi:hypothetical protein